MKWYDELPRDSQKEINMISGVLGLPSDDDYKDLSYFLHDVRSKIIESKYLLDQAGSVLNV